MDNCLRYMHIDGTIYPYLAVFFSLLRYHLSLYRRSRPDLAPGRLLDEITIPSFSYPSVAATMVNS